MSQEKMYEKREMNLDPIARQMDNSIRRLSELKRIISNSRDRSIVHIEDRISYLMEKHPGMNCYKLALILKSEFAGEIWYDVDHCVFVSNYGFPYDKNGKLDDINERMAPLSTYGDEIVDELIKSI